MIDTEGIATAVIEIALSSIMYTLECIVYNTISILWHFGGWMLVIAIVVYIFIWIILRSTGITRR